MLRPSLSLVIQNYERSPGPDLRALTDIARVAEEAGLDQVALGDHVAIGPDASQYRWGTFPSDPEHPWLEPLTSLAVVAAVTTKVRLATGVLLVTCRPAVFLAKQVATLDVLSGGRVDLGVGTGWQRAELAACGVPWHQRWEYFDDALRACRRLWEEAPTSYRSELISFDDLASRPAPQQARLPIWVGARATDATARRIAEYADGWWADPAAGANDVAAGVSRLRAALVDAGRNPDALLVRARLAPVAAPNGGFDAPATMGGAGPMLAAGANVLSIPIQPGLRSLAELRAYLDRMVDAFDRATGRPTTL